MTMPPTNFGSVRDSISIGANKLVLALHAVPVNITTRIARTRIVNAAGVSAEHTACRTGKASKRGNFKMIYLQYGIHLKIADRASHVLKAFKTLLRVLSCPTRKQTVAKKKSGSVQLRTFDVPI